MEDNACELGLGWLFMLGISSFEPDEITKQAFDTIRPKSCILTLKYFKQENAISSIGATLARYNTYIVALDQEGGQIQHIGPPCFTLFPPLGCLSHHPHLDDVGHAMAVQLKHAIPSAEVIWNLAPVADLDHPRYHFHHLRRALHSQPSLVTSQLSLLVQGMQSVAGVASCLKVTLRFSSLSLLTSSALSRHGLYRG